MPECYGMCVLGYLARRDVLPVDQAANRQPEQVRELFYVSPHLCVGFVFYHDWAGFVGNADAIIGQKNMKLKINRKKFY